MASRPRWSVWKEQSSRKRERGRARGTEGTEKRESIQRREMRRGERGQVRWGESGRVGMG
jgi:hypothetical protein